MGFVGLERASEEFVTVVYDRVAYGCFKVYTYSLFTVFLIRILGCSVYVGALGSAIFGGCQRSGGQG